MIWKWVRAVISSAVFTEAVRLFLPKGKLYKSVSVVLCLIVLSIAVFPVSNFKEEVLSYDKIELDVGYIDYVKELTAESVKEKINEICQKQGLECENSQIEFKNGEMQIQKIIIIFDEGVLFEDDENIIKIENIINKTCEYFSLDKEVITVKYA